MTNEIRAMTTYFSEKCVQQIIQQLTRFLQQIIVQVKQLLGFPTKSPRKPRCAFNWVIQGKLAVAGFPQPSDAAELLQAGIEVVFSLCSELEATLPDDIVQNFNCLRLVLPDRYYTTELTAEQLSKAVAIIHNSLENNQPIYVHCLAGVERSPTVCIAYLCKYEKMELWEAVNWLKQIHPSSQPSDSGLRAIREFLQQ